MPRLRKLERSSQQVEKVEEDSRRKERQKRGVNKLVEPSPSFPDGTGQGTLGRLAEERKFFLSSLYKILRQAAFNSFP